MKAALLVLPALALAACATTAPPAARVAPPTSTARSATVNLAPASASLVSGRLTAMCFFVSYTLASIGPSAMGAVRDVTGGFPAVWATLVVLMAVQITLALLLRPGLQRTA